MLQKANKAEMCENEEIFQCAKVHTNAQMYTSPLFPRMLHIVPQGKGRVGKGKGNTG